MRRRITYVILAGLLALCLWPAALVYWSQRYAQQHGCEFGFKMHQDGCWVDGVNMADRLHAAYSNAGVLIVTIPAAFVIFLCVLLMISIDVQRRRAKKV